MTEATTPLPDQRALAASTVALMIAVACIAMFFPPLVEHTVPTPLRATATAGMLAGAMLLHWVYLCLGARRMQRSVAGWLGLSVLLFPVGSAVALILLTWFCDEAATQGPAAHRA